MTDPYRASAFETPVRYEAHKTHVSYGWQVSATARYPIVRMTPMEEMLGEVIPWLATHNTTSIRSKRGNGTT